jgi:hypothetical protein
VVLLRPAGIAIAADHLGDRMAVSWEASQVPIQPGSVAVRAGFEIGTKAQESRKLRIIR